MSLKAIETMKRLVERPTVSGSNDPTTVDHKTHCVFETSPCSNQGDASGAIFINKTVHFFLNWDTMFTVCKQIICPRTNILSRGKVVDKLFSKDKWLVWISQSLARFGLWVFDKKQKERIILMNLKNQKRN